MVLGNPPYVNVKRGIDSKHKLIYQRIYKTAVKQFDLFTLFIEQGLKLSNNILTLIIPKPFINNENYEVARELLLKNGLINVVIGSKIFENADVENSIIISSKSPFFTVSEVLNDKSIIHKHITPLSLCESLPFKMINTEISPKTINIFKKIQNTPNKLMNCVDITRGIEGGKSDNCITFIQNEHKLLRGNDVERYRISFNNLYCNFDKNNTSKFKPISIYRGEKILIRRVSDKLIATFDNENFLTLNTIYCCKSISENYNLKFICGLINSRVIQFWFTNMFVLTDKLFPYIRKSQLDLVPIPKLNSKEQSQIIEIVDQILIAKKVTHNEEISILEAQIDSLVYKLYDLTYDEVKVINPDIQLSEAEYDALK